MKITKQELVNIIKEEVEKALSDKGVNEVDIGEPNMFPTPTEDRLAELPRMVKLVARAAEFTDNLLERLELLDPAPFPIDPTNANMEKYRRGNRKDRSVEIGEQEFNNLHAIAERIREELSLAMFMIKKLARQKGAGIFAKDAKKLSKKGREKVKNLRYYKE
jgi:hypothetical protein